MAGTASSEMSIRHGVRIQPDPSVPVEAVLLAAGECAGHVNLSYASRMNKGVVVFLKEERFVAELIAIVSERRLPAGFPARCALHSGHSFSCSPVHSQRGVGVGAPALWEAGERFQDCGFRLLE